MTSTPTSGVSDSPTTSSSLAQLIYLQHQVITKLDDSNYLLWKQQILATIEGFGLEKFLEEDQLITSWLLLSITESVLVGIVGLTTSREIWETVESNYASQSRAKLMQIKFQLQTLKKGGLSMKEYLNKIKSCCDILGSAGERLSDENHVLHILAGLGPEYNSAMQTSFNIDGLSPTANVITRTQHGRGSCSYNSNRGRDSFNNNRGRGYGRGNNLGRGGRFNGNWRPRCQICHIIGHTADRCHERHNTNFNPSKGNDSQGNRGFNSQTVCMGLEINMEELLMRALQQMLQT
ncbi:hypothetical protein C2S52_017946 [Perilla frutescens var. hirtella]|nr:hypothetical protein C2S52_017946 [Perilla frutescens var. hirtella]